MSLASLPALAQTAPIGVDCSAIQFEMANPSPGSRIDPGKYVVQGIALDTRAQEGPGIDRVDFFLGSRDEGGILLGHAVPSTVDSFGILRPNSFETTISVPNLVGGRDLFGYAHSAVANQENVIALPIAVGVEPSKVADHMAMPPMSMCTGGVPATPMPIEVSEPEMPMPEMAAMESATQETDDAPPAEMAMPESAAMRMFLDVGNPSSGDNVHVGRYMIEGIAFDRTAEQGAGIERVDVFVDDRDTGGVLIGTGQLGVPSPVPDDPELSNAGWNAQVTIPRNLIGPHTVFVYALSAITGGELVVSIPVNIVP